MRRAARHLALLGILATAACVTNTNPDSGYALSQGQIRLIVPVIAAAALGPVFGTVPGQLPSPPLVAPELAPLSFPMDSTTPCSTRGSIRFTGTATGDIPGGTGSLTLGASETVAYCAISSDTTTYTVASLPTLTVFGLIRYSAGAAVNTQSLYIQGTIQVVNSTGQQAVCSADLLVTADLPTHTARVTGNVCFIGVDVPASWATE